MIGLFAVLVALSVLIPFPGTNFPPSIALVIVSIAVMEEDGYLLIGGYLIGLAGLAYTVTVLGASYHLIHARFTSWFWARASAFQDRADGLCVGGLRRFISPLSSTAAA